MSKLPVPGSLVGARMDRVLRHMFPQLPFSARERLIRTNQIRLELEDGSRLKVRRGKAPLVQEARFVVVPKSIVTREEVECSQEATLPSASLQDMFRSWLIYKDQDVLVINKPPGYASQKGSKVPSHRAVDWLSQGLATTDDPIRLVHRLDKETSGAMLLARSRQAAVAMTGQFAKCGIQKEYWALVDGEFQPPSGRMESFMCVGARGKMESHTDMIPGAKYACTQFRVQANIQDQSWLLLWPQTGRKHQIRVQCAEQGTPIMGDTRYGPTTSKGPLFLHSRAVRFPCLATGEIMKVVAPLPRHMEFLEGLQRLKDGRNVT